MSRNDLRRLAATVLAGHRYPVVIAPVSFLGIFLIRAIQEILGTSPIQFWAIAFLLSSALLLIAVTNRVLFRHLITISGRRDVPIEIPAAIVRSVLLLFALINLYAAIYFAQIGDEECRQPGFWICATRDVVRWLYFSTVTFSTLGYGDITPKGNVLAEIVASIEALNGLIAFGVFTGALTTYLSKNED